VTTLASKIVLSEVDNEITLLGTLLMSPENFGAVCGRIRPEWFSDGLLRYMFETACRITAEGGRISPQPIIAALPEDCGGIRRQDLYARVCGAAMPMSSLSGMVSVAKDRWARRELLARAEDIRARAELSHENPFDIASDIVLGLDGVNADRGESRIKTFDDAMEDMDQAPTKRQGVTTGLMSLDKKLNGYVPGQLYVIAGRPGMGKSAFMCSSLRRTAMMGKGVAIFSLEMTAAEIGARCVSDALDSMAAPMFGSVLNGMMSQDQKDMVRLAKDSLSGLPMFIEDEARLTFTQITAKAREVKAKFNAAGIPLSVVCIDHMGLVTPSNRYAGNKVAEAGEVSGQARALAKELDCCVILLCQLSRDVEKRDDKRPMMADLRWSGEIEQDAHVIGFLYREAYYLAQDADADPVKVHTARNVLEFLIRKNRNGETADVRLWCSIGHSMIRDE
jgi:replicative DNA helicase